MSGAVLLSLIVVGFTLYYGPINDPYYPFNYGWNGCSTLTILASHASFLLSYSEGIPLGDSLLAIIGPSIPFDSVDSARVSTFLSSGGVILLADDFGSGNTLLQNLNVSARFAGKQISDVYFYSKQPFYPLISSFVSDPITRNLRLVLMNRPSYLEVLDNRTVRELAFSSPLSFVDVSANGTLSPNEGTQPYPVVASAHVGNGVLILVSNAALFTNGVIGSFNNTILFRNLLDLAGGGVIFDLSHVPRAPLTDLRVTFKADVDYLSLALNSAKVMITIGVALIFAVVFGLRLRSNHASSAPRTGIDGSRQ